MNEHLTYLLLELGWSLPVIALHWLRGWRMLWRVRKALLWATLVPTLFLSLADSVALEQRIWSVSSLKTTGLFVANLPIEEIIFFATTNVIIVQSMLLLFSLRLRSVTEANTAKNLATNPSRGE